MAHITSIYQYLIQHKDLLKGENAFDPNNDRNGREDDQDGPDDNQVARNDPINHYLNFFHHFSSSPPPSSSQSPPSQSSSSIFIAIGATTHKGFDTTMSKTKLWQEEIKIILDQQERIFEPILDQQETTFEPILDQHEDDMKLNTLEPDRDVKSNEDKSKPLTVLNKNKLKQLAHLFLHFDFNPMLTCTVPSPQGVKEQIDLYLGQQE
jgi:hypothetical protein